VFLVLGWLATIVKDDVKFPRVPPPSGGYDVHVFQPVLYGSFVREVYGHAWGSLEV